MLKILILNDYDVSMCSGLAVDLDVCRLLKAHCYGIPVSVTDGEEAVSDLSDTAIRFLTVTKLESFNALKLTSAVGSPILESLIGVLDRFRFRTLVVSLRRAQGGGTKTVEAMARHSDLAVVDAMGMEWSRLGISGKDIDCSEVLKVLGTGSVVIANYGNSQPYLNILCTGSRYLQIRSMLRYSVDILATYMTVRVCSGDSLADVFEDAIRLCEGSMRYGLRVEGRVMPNVLFKVELDSERYRVLTRLREAIDILEDNSELVTELVPEVQMNLAYALPKQYLRGVEDVAAVPGRIVRVGNMVKAVEAPDFGTSRHLARALLKVMEYDPSKRSVANIRFSEEVIKVAEGLGYKVSFYDRSKEPPEVKAVEGATIPWGIEQAVKMVGRVPDIVYHRGDYGKEAMVTVIGLDPVDVVSKILKIAEGIRSRRT